MLNNDIEEWRSIKGYEDIYWVSSTGLVKNSRKVLRPFINNSGYRCIDLTREGVRKKFLVHRLVAETFLENVDNLSEVNHIDEDKLNNNVVNLEWVTSSYNKRYSMASGAYDAIYKTRNSLGKKHVSTASIYHNVGWDRFKRKWVGGVRHRGKNYFQRRFDSEVDAALHVNWIIDHLELTDRPKNIIETPND